MRVSRLSLLPCTAVWSALPTSLSRSYGPAAFSYYRINTFNDAQIVARKACDEQVDWIIIAGGDGTLRAISEVLVERDYMPYVSIYPAGTVNLVAKELA